MTDRFGKAPAVPILHRMPRRWRSLVSLALVGLVVGAVVVARPWSGNEIPAASEYSSASDLARDLNEHGLGCAHPIRTRLLKLGYRYFAIWIDRRLLAKSLVCSVGGRPVVVSVLPPASVKVWFGSPNLQDAFAHGDDSLAEGPEVDAVLVGLNWMVMTRQGHDSIPALSAIRGEIGGRLVVASPTPTPSPST